MTYAFLLGLLPHLFVTGSAVVPFIPLPLSSDRSESSTRSGRFSFLDLEQNSYAKATCYFFRVPKL